MAQSGQPVGEHAIAAVEIIVGKPALAEFELERLRGGLAGAGIDVASLVAREVFVAAFNRAPSADDRMRLHGLLGLDAIDDMPEGVIAIPRLGTVSPWSTKAEDIAHNSGLDALARLERGVVFSFGSTPDFEALAQSGVLHDPMTQSLLPNAERCLKPAADMARLFVAHPGALARTVQIAQREDSAA